MANYRRGETIVVKGELTDSDGSGFNLADFTTFSVTITDESGDSYSYSVADNTVNTIPDGDTSSYYYVITPAQSSVLKGNIKETITATFLDNTYSITVTDKVITRDILTLV